MRFVVPTREQVASDAEERAYLTNYESVPWLCRNHWDEDQFVVNRQVRDSGYLHFPWKSAQHGSLMLSTATLVEREEPYNLALELARGTTYRLRQQMHDWLDQGLRDAGTAQSTLQEAMALFIRAATSQWSPQMTHSLAVEAIELALGICRDLVNRYVDQVLEIRHRNTTQFNTLFGVNVNGAIPTDDQTTQIVDTFNTVVLPLHWRDIEVSNGEFSWKRIDSQLDWCQQAGFKVVAGPLMALNQMAIPDWLYLWEGDGSAIVSLVSNYVSHIVDRYHKSVGLWHCMAVRAADERLGLSESERLKVLVAAVESLRKVDSQTPLIISFDQPWGDHMSRDDIESSPWTFADALVRSNLNLSAIGLEFNFGYQHGCSIRDLMEISRRLDAWSYLGVPLIAFLTVPSRSDADPNLVGEESILDDARGHVTPEWQTQWAGDLSRLLLAKRSVQGIVWNQWSDGEPHLFPNGGLLDTDHQAKPALERLRGFRQEHLL